MTCQQPLPQLLPSQTMGTCPSSPSTTSNPRNHSYPSNQSLSSQKSLRARVSCCTSVDGMAVAACWFANCRRAAAVYILRDQISCIKPRKGFELVILGDYALRFATTPQPLNQLTCRDQVHRLEAVHQHRTHCRHRRHLRDPVEICELLPAHFLAPSCWMELKASQASLFGLATLLVCSAPAADTMALSPPLPPPPVTGHPHRFYPSCCTRPLR